MLDASCLPLIFRGAASPRRTRSGPLMPFTEPPQCQALLGSPWGTPQVHNRWRQAATAAWPRCLLQEGPGLLCAPLPSFWFHTSHMSTRPMWSLLGGTCGPLWDFLDEGSPTQQVRTSGMVTPALVSIALHSIDLCLVAALGNRSAPLLDGDHDTGLIGALVLDLACSTTC